MQEIEAKFIVSDLVGIRMRLHTLGAHLIQERILETNIRFELPDGSLRSGGRVLRLRQDTEARLTYKGPGRDLQGILDRTEIEIVVENFEKAKQLLEALGYHDWFHYEKYRTTYDLESTNLPMDPQEHILLGTRPAGSNFCHIMLDELPYGNFVEIEGNSVETIRAAAGSLNLFWDHAIPASYHALFERLCTLHPELDPSDLSFDALAGVTVQPDDLSVHLADV